MEVGGFTMAQMNSRPFGLMHALCPLLTGSLALLGNPRQKGESKAPVMYTGHVVQRQQPPELC